MRNLGFDIQRFVDYTRRETDKTLRGRRRLSGNYGRVYINNALIFEVSAFSTKVTFEREDIWIGNSKDSKVTGLTGEGELTIKQVFSRGFDVYMKNQLKGWDERFQFIGYLADPDTLNGEYEFVKFDNVWINEIEVIKFEKASVIEKTIPFGFTPEDVEFSKSIGAPDETSDTTIGTVEHVTLDNSDYGDFDDISESVAED